MQGINDVVLIFIDPGLSNEGRNVCWIVGCDGNVAVQITILVNASCSINHTIRNDSEFKWLTYPVSGTQHALNGIKCTALPIPQIPRRSVTSKTDRMLAVSNTITSTLKDVGTLSGLSFSQEAASAALTILEILQVLLNNTLFSNPTLTWHLPAECPESQGQLSSIGE